MIPATAIISVLACIALIVFIFSIPNILRNAEQQAVAQEEAQNTLSDPDIDSIFKGIRPNGMSMEDFKEYRRDKEKHVRRRSKGVIQFKSKTGGVKIVRK